MFQQGYQRDAEFKEAWYHPETSSLFVKNDELLFLRSANKLTRLCVPNNNRLRTQVISEYHDSPIAAHPGTRTTFLRVAQWYYWKSLLKDIKEYVKTCETCARWKHDNQRKKVTHANSYS